jgi:cAMP-binding proteins - catabolite gene activator and regulatory subunit of cAMP-dependent protein kinases
LQTSPKNCEIYQAGDIGWDIYFIGSGLVKVKLPKDLSILDEEGRACVAVTNNKASSVGVIYRPGNHFGESCLESTSGVRRETIIAITTVELHILSKESLEKIFNYTPQQERNLLKKNLLSRNGNVWHLFDSENSPLSNNSSAAQETKTSVAVKQTPPSVLRRTKYQHHLSLSNNSKQVSEYSRKLTPRLRSFSAEASAQALQKRQEHHNACSGKTPPSPYKRSYQVFAAPVKTSLDPVQAAKLVYAGHITSMGNDSNISKTL